VKCKKIKKFISRYFDNSLMEYQKEIMFEHIKNCLNCRKEFDILSKIYKYLPKYKDVEISRDISWVVLSRIKRLNKHWGVVLWRKVMPVAVSFLIIILSTMINPCKNNIENYTSYIFYPQEEIDFAEIELISFLSTL